MSTARQTAFTALSYAELSRRLGSDTRAKAALKWLYKDGLPDSLPERVPGVAHREWARLRASHPLPAWKQLAKLESEDGTTKLALDLDGAKVETVLIPGPQRSTVCLSSQAGCTRSCAFCATAKLGFLRNLTAGEIVAQYVLAQRLAPPGRPARNVVFMGMGEPMDNLEHVLAAVELLIQAPYPALSPAHVTVSTAGVVPQMRRFLKASKASLALSLNATTDEIRERVMPHNALWPIEKLMETLRTHASDRETFIEYVLFAGLNDTPEDAERLPKLLEGVPARINLIPFNGNEGSGFVAPKDDQVTAFQKAVAKGGIRTLVRWPRGREIAAACGQLANKV
ncbi:MAG: 23S rRNA (adenine(2503)-C(2))-methyltransferase RlmN [Deltaproteobacteria bacterium]|nr:23S rRNA (adenine(2503)-C(2))-methyltransferase RlmN [Deltaproteobacteria bacterium]